MASIPSESATPPVPSPAPAHRPSGPRDVTKKILLVTSSLLLSLIALELGARILLHFRGPLEGGTTFAAYGRYDPILGWSKLPRAHVKFKRYEFETDIAINSQGLRDPERSYAKPAGTFRVLALGDSYVEGFTVPLESTVTQVLERALKSPSCPVEVLNGGTTGYSTDQECLFFETEGVQYDPDVVLLFFYYNDILANAMQSVVGGIPKPIFVLDGDGLRVYETPVKRTGRAPFAATPAQSEGSPSALVALIQQRLWFGAPAVYNAIGRLGLWAPNRPVGAALELRVYSTEAIPKLENAWERTRRLIVRLRRDVTARGGRFAVVYVPNNMEVDERAWSYSKARYGMDEAKWDRGRVLSRLKTITDSNAIPLIDLTTALRQATQKSGRVYFPQDGHWNALGHATAARAVGSFVQGWLPGCETPRVP